MQALGARGTLITQNVDGLHRRATVDGAPPPRLFEIHGNLDLMRPADNANVRLSVPEHFDAPRTEGEQTALSDEDRALLRAPDGGWYRPHVLWFDETYDEENYRFESSIRAATEADLLITVGTTAGTNLPRHVVGLALRNGALLVDVNIAENDFAEAARVSGGAALRGKSGVLLPALIACSAAPLAKSSGA
jgi:NAD-dependent deacetylase